MPEKIIGSFLKRLDTLFSTKKKDYYGRNHKVDVVDTTHPYLD